MGKVAQGDTGSETGGGTGRASGLDGIRMAGVWRARLGPTDPQSGASLRDLEPCARPGRSTDLELDGAGSQAHLWAKPDGAPQVIFRGAVVSLKGSW